MSKLFNVAGTSKLEGVTTYRFANKLSRATVLLRNGHTEVKLFTLPEPMTKEQAVEHMRSVGIIAALPVGHAQYNTEELDVQKAEMEKEARAA